jgi:hypothetical protein
MKRIDARTAVAGVFVILSSFAGAGHAQDKVLQPPFQMAGTNHVIVGVEWDEAVIKRVLPAGIKAVKGATGAINIYQVDRGFGIAPYQSVYMWVDIEGFDSPDGTKGRWMLAGAYGPKPETSKLLKEVYGMPVRNGTSRMEATAAGKRAVGSVEGVDVVVAEIRTSDECGPVGGVLNYPTAKKVVNVIPFTGTWCKAEPVAVEIVAPAGDPFAQFKPAKVVWAGEFRDGAFAFANPVPYK